MELARIWCGMHADARVLIVSASKLTPTEKEEAVYLPNNHVKLSTSLYLNDMFKEAEEWFLGESSVVTSDAPESDKTLQYFDTAVHAKLVMLGGDAFLQKALRRFADRMPSRMENFRSFIQARDERSLHREAHSLKGSCGIVGANTLLELADMLETAAQEEEESDRLNELVSEISGAWQKTSAELEQILSGQ